MGLNFFRLKLIKLNDIMWIKKLLWKLINKNVTKYMWIKQKISVLQCYVMFAVCAGTIQELCGNDRFSDNFEEYSYNFLKF